VSVQVGELFATLKLDKGRFEQDVRGAGSLWGGLAKVALGGLILVFGNSSKEPSKLDFRDFAGRDRVRVQSFFSAHYEHLAADNLRTLLALVAAGRLQVEVGLETPLADVNDALDALDQRRVAGKAILRPR